MEQLLPSGKPVHGVISLDPFAPFRPFPITRGIVARRPKVIHLSFLLPLYGPCCHATAEMLVWVIFRVACHGLWAA